MQRGKTNNSEAPKPNVSSIRIGRSLEKPSRPARLVKLSLEILQIIRVDGAGAPPYDPDQDGRPDLLQIAAS
jgi:hypothetical protein